MTPEQTEAHRRACEAREVLLWPLEQRREYLRDVERIRGKDAAYDLRAEVLAQHAQREAVREKLKEERTE